MEKKWHNLYQSPEDITSDMLLKYVRKELPLAERHLVEKHMLDYPYLADTVEGLEMLIEEGEDPAAMLILLDGLLASKVEQPEETKTGFNWRWLAAASVLVLAGLSVVWWNSADVDPDPQYTENKPVETETEDDQQKEIELLDQDEEEPAEEIALEEVEEPRGDLEQRKTLEVLEDAEEIVLTDADVDEVEDAELAFAPAESISEEQAKEDNYYIAKDKNVTFDARNESRESASKPLTLADSVDLLGQSDLDDAAVDKETDQEELAFAEEEKRDQNASLRYKEIKEIPIAVEKNEEVAVSEPQRERLEEVTISEVAVKRPKGRFRANRSKERLTDPKKKETGDSPTPHKASASNANAAGKMDYPSLLAASKTQLQNGQAEEARDGLMAYLNANPDDLEARTVLGKAHMQLDELPEAIEQFNFVLDEPEGDYYREAAWLKANVLLTIEKVGKARALLQKLADSPGDFQQEAIDRLAELDP